MTVREVRPAVPVVPGSASAVARRAICLLLIVASALTVGPTPVAADEKATLENIFLIEQLADVASTQQLLHTASCSRMMPIVDPDTHATVGAVRHCALGSERDPLARPFVKSVGLNTVTAVAINGLLRLALHGLAPNQLRYLRYGVELYPTIIIGNVTELLHVQRFTPEVTLSIRRRF
jgi:hypothetical protein